MEKTPTENSAACGQSRSTVVLERKQMGLAEFIERCGGFELKPYQRELVAAVERGERLMLDPVTMREPYCEWKRRYEEYVAELMRSNE